MDSPFHKRSVVQTLSRGGLSEVSTKLPVVQVFTEHKTRPYQLCCHSAPFLTSVSGNSWHVTAS